MSIRKIIRNRIAKLRLPKMLCLIFLLSIAVTSFSQGIKWSDGLTWQQVKAKAKKENKYMFVDCYATWCKPCKAMDKEVYSVDSVGSFLNQDFISVKLQMDQTKNDAAAIKSWYKTASSFAKDYNLNAYPTMLFFTPSGEVATKEVGYKDAGAFITAARNAKDPSKQYYVLLKNYKKGKLDDAATRSLINTAKQLGDTATYHALRNSYFAYLHTLPKAKLYTKENIEFIATTINRHSQSVFDMFYPDATAVDKVMEKKGYAQKVVDDVIMKEKVASVVNAGMDAKIEPDWSILYNSIAKDYKRDYAERNIMEAKMAWYYNAGDYFKWASTLNHRIEKYGTDTTSKSADFVLNNQAYIIWLNLGQTDKPDPKTIEELNRVCKWLEGPLRRYEFATGFRLQQWPMIIDTYANLLYKVGRTTEALKWQELAVSKGKELGTDDDAMKDIENNLALMKEGKPTWPIAAN
ncbi:MAG: thioredoxin fold domain-containing protein [Chitinophagaceae bacterium]